MLSARRTLPAAASIVLLAALAHAPGALGTTQNALIASPSQCPAATSFEASPSQQRAALLCMINFARATAGLRPVRRSWKLSRVARSKGRDIALCHDFDHGACGRSPFADVAVTGFRYRIVGENLFAAERPIGTANDAFLAWLSSPSHRRVLFLKNFSDAGIALLRLPRLADVPHVQLWVLELAQRA